MIVKGIVDEDCANYKKCSMFIIFPYCSLKCDKENGNNYCQNSPLMQEPNIEISPDAICQRYLNNPLSKAMVLGGLEPFDSPDEVIDLVSTLRVKYCCSDDIVIYTGYTEDELKTNCQAFHTLQYYTPIIVKFGRFRPNQEPHHDEILGVDLMNDEQYAKKIGDGSNE